MGIVNCKYFYTSLIIPKDNVHLKSLIILEQNV